MDVLIVLFAAVLFWNCRYTEFNQDYLSIDNSCIIKGFCSLLIVIHHIAQRTNGGLLFPLFGYIGFLAVGMFYFYSGYGLMSQFQVRGNAYLRHFFTKRIWKVLLPYLIANVVYLVIDFVSGVQYEWSELIRKILSGRIVPFSWFVISIIVVYIIFWVSCTVAGRGCEIMMIAIGITVYSLICMKLETPPQWYTTVYAFLFGNIYSRIRKPIERFFQTRYWMKLIFLLGSALIFLLIAEIGTRPIYQMIFFNACVISFITLVLGITMKFAFRNRVLSFLGENNYELYLYQGIFVSRIMIGENFVYAVSTIALLLIIVAAIRMIQKHLLPGGEKGKR